MIQENKKTELRFKNLPFLLNDMERKKWIIDSFPFKYKEKKYIVILTKYKENERKPSVYAKAKVEFIQGDNINNSIKGYIDFYNVHFISSQEFCYFFGVQRGNANRNLFEDFSEIFSHFIPKEKFMDKNAIERILIGRRAEGNNPNAIYCYDVRRNGRKEDGSPNERSIENDNKAQSLRPQLYEKFSSDTNLSFFFSDRQEDEKTDKEILEIFSRR
ncbi:DUF6037 family protein [Pectinatus frisingensis]|uniref:DUF6037 family protein n=1 Tax=Pectinatus frisingensis TaxID=865 RepID=UPI0018C66FCC|nr:DUF6037 family protein [Pectinatus frisingensis]